MNLNNCNNLKVVIRITGLLNHVKQLKWERTHLWFQWSQNHWHSCEWKYPGGLHSQMKKNMTFQLVKLRTQFTSISWPVGLYLWTPLITTGFRLSTLFKEMDPGLFRVKNIKSDEVNLTLRKPTCTNFGAISKMVLRRPREPPS